MIFLSPRELIKQNGNSCNLFEIDVGITTINSSKNICALINAIVLSL
jgi:hypothetical protein